MKWLTRHVRPEQLRELVLVALVIGIAVFFSTQIDNYFSGRFFNRVSTSVAIVAVITVGQTLVILTRNIDLSVGSIVGCTAYFVGTLLAINNGIPPWAAVALAMALGAVMGSLNGVLVAYGRVPAIIVTLGTLALYRTALVELSGAKTVVSSAQPQWMIDLPTISLFSLGDLDIRLLFFIAIIVVVLFQLILTYLPFGRRIYAIGSIRTRRASLASRRSASSSAPSCSPGTLAGLAGFMFLARFGNITVVAGQGLELKSVAAAVVGGVNINGGVGSMFGAFLGAVLIDLLEQSLIRWLGISEFWRDALLGLLILLAVATDTVIMNRLRAYWSRSELHLEDIEGTTGGPTSGQESGHVA